MFRNSSRMKDVKRTSGPVVEKWGAEHGFVFPKEFVSFVQEFGGIHLSEDWGYQFIDEDDDLLDFGTIGTFFHFDPDVWRKSVPDEYKLRCREHWNQPDLVPFASTEINTHAVLDFRASRDAPAVYNADFFCASEADPERPRMTWLAGSFTDFLDILEPEEDYLARNPD